MAFKKLKLWFDKDLLKMLSDKILEVQPDFPAAAFKKGFEKEVKELELKDRVERMADRLNQHLTGDYPQKIKLLLQILGPENEEETGMFTEFYWVMPIAKFVEKYGLNHFDLSMRAIREITKRNTSEYTIRPFIEQNQDKTMAQLLKWSKHKNKHVRRLASEGPRPRLPWATKLQGFIDNPAPLLPILENLKDDPSKYVQKSVANCMNDILKDNEAIAKKTLQNWTKNAGKERKWIIKHALRNFLKKDVAWAKAMVKK